MVFQGNGFRLTSAIQLKVNLLHHRVEITGHIRIPETDDPVSFLLQPCLPFAIALGRRVVVVMPAIEFDDQSLCRTKEVDDIGDRLAPVAGSVCPRLVVLSTHAKACAHAALYLPATSLPQRGG